MFNNHHDAADPRCRRRSSLLACLIEALQAQFFEDLRTYIRPTGAFYDPGCSTTPACVAARKASKKVPKRLRTTPILTSSRGTAPTIDFGLLSVSNCSQPFVTTAPASFPQSSRHSLSPLVRHAGPPVCLFGGADPQGQRSPVWYPLTRGDRQWKFLPLARSSDRKSVV